MLQLDAILEQFEERWRNGSPPHLKQFVDSLNLEESHQRDVLPELIALELEYRWRLSRETETVINHDTSSRSGGQSALTEKPTLDDYAKQWPELFAHPDAIADLIAEEFRVRHRWGDQPEVDEYLQRYGECPAVQAALSEVQRELSLDQPPAEVSEEPFPEQQDSLPRHFGRYELLELLGRGGMGEVYRAHDTELDRAVALKMPRLDRSFPQLRQRFVQEARAAATLRHPHICPVFDAGEIDGQPFLTMAYIDGKNLQEHWKGDELRALPQTLTILAQVARGIQAAHDQQVVHRDLKPANVMIDHQGEPVVMDFGLAHRAAGEQAGRITQTGQTLGSPAYMSPEQIEGRTDDVSPASDVYSLGVMLFESLTGELPFNGSMGQILAAVTRDEPPQPSALKPTVDGELETLCLQMLAKTSAERPASMTNVADRIDSIQKRLEVEAAAKATQPVANSVPHKNRRWLSALLGIAAVVLLGLFITIQTDKGTIVVRSDVPGVDVLIRQGKNAVDQFEVQTGEKSTTIASGEYEIVLQGEKVDGLRVTPNKVTLTRNKTEVVTVERITPKQLAIKGQPPANTGVSEDWLEEMAKLSARDRYQKVVAKLQELNPGYDGRVERVDYQRDSETQKDIVFRLVIFANLLRDISPVQALTKLNSFFCNGATTASGKLTDISPLANLPHLIAVDLADNPRISDLSPLAGLKLRYLDVRGTRVDDLSPMQGKPLVEMDCSDTRVTDISPLADGKKLRKVTIRNTGITDLSPLRGHPLTELHMESVQVSDVSPLQDAPLRVLHFDASQVSDLSPLKTMPLKQLACYGLPKPDLSVFQGMKLTNLKLQKAGVTDLVPLKEMPLTNLSLRYNFSLSDLTPLQGMKLQLLDLTETRVSDLSPLKGMPLETITLPPKIHAEMLVMLRSIKTLKTINNQPVESYFKSQGHVSEQWLEQVAMQGADARLDSVLKKLQELNPGFDGKAKDHRINGQGFARKVRVLNIYSDHMVDVSPLKALPHLHVLSMEGVNWRKSPLRNVSPLSALQELKILHIGNHGKLSDISPLEGLKLEDLLIYHTNVSDLSPVKGMPLEKFGFGFTPVSDLTPLAEIKTLRKMWFHHSKHVSDLTPLSRLQLTYLNCSDTAVTSLSPLRNAPLTWLLFSGTDVTDYSPLKDMPLEHVVLPQHPVRGTPVGEAAPKGKPLPPNLAVLRSIKSLKQINEKPTDQFWKKHRLTTDPVENGTQKEQEQGQSSSQKQKAQD